IGARLGSLCASDFETGKRLLVALGKLGIAQAQQRVADLYFVAVLNVDLGNQAAHFGKDLGLVTRYHTPGNAFFERQRATRGANHFDGGYVALLAAEATGSLLGAAATVTGGQHQSEN